MHGNHRIMRHAPAAIWMAALTLATGAGAAPVAVRQASTLAAPRLATVPAIDGRLDDAAWGGAQPLRDWAYRSGGVRCQTEGWVARDDTHLYFAGRCFDDNLAGLVTANRGQALWKNDCIELFIVPDKDPLFFTHIVLACDGQFSAPSWVPDAWGEPTAGPAIAVKYATGRETNAWTFEASVPLAAFARAITPRSVWALGFNREKQGEPVEVSSFQGGFNKPKQYPDLVFDERTVLADGLGLRNIGAAPRTVRVSIKAEGAVEGRTLDLTLPPAQRVAIPWSAHVGGLQAGQAFTIDTADTDGRPLLHESYRLAEAARPTVAVDPAHIPPARFEPSSFDDDAFFPIAVWGQPAGVAREYAAMGVNVFVGGMDAYPKPRDREYLDVLWTNGCRAFAPFKAAYVEEKLHQHPAFLGWLHGDEPDNMDSATAQVKESPEAVVASFARIRAADPAHRIFLNLGQGVAEERFVGRGASLAQYREYPKGCDILCFDVYPCNSVEPDGTNRLHLVAKGIDRLRAWGGPEKPVWAWIEVNQFGKDNGGRCPTPDEVRTQIWMALVHGARGYGFFCHSWCKPWMKQALGVDRPMSVSAIAPEMRQALKVINAEVRALAPVLNSDTIADGATVETGAAGRVDIMVKRHGGKTYLFAVNMRRQPAAATFQVAGFAEGKARVLHGNREVAVEKGSFRETFAPYAVHAYELVPGL